MAERIVLDKLVQTGTDEQKAAIERYYDLGDASWLIECGLFRQCPKCGYYSEADMPDVWGDHELLCCDCARA